MAYGNHKGRARTEEEEEEEAGGWGGHVTLPLLLGSRARRRDALLEGRPGQGCDSYLCPCLFRRASSHRPGQPPSPQTLLRQLVPTSSYPGQSPDVR